MLTAPNAAPARAERSGGFSLVEVTLAVGIMAFSLLAILGLLSMGMQGSRESGEDTVLALAARQVATWGRAQPFATLAALAEEEAQATFFFDEHGLLSRDADGLPVTTAPADAHYLCAVSVWASGVSPHLLRLRYRFEWPLAAPAAARQNRVIVASRVHEE